MNYENKTDADLRDIQQQLIYACEHVGLRAQDYDDFKAINAELRRRQRERDQEFEHLLKQIAEQRFEQKQRLLLKAASSSQ